VLPLWLEYWLSEDFVSSERFLYSCTLAINTSTLLAALGIFLLSFIHGHQTDRGTVCFNPDSILCKLLPGLKSGMRLCGTYWVLVVEILGLIIVAVLIAFNILFTIPEFIEIVRESTLSGVIEKIMDLFSDFFGFLVKVSPSIAAFLVPMIILVIIAVELYKRYKWAQWLFPILAVALGISAIVGFLVLIIVEEVGWIETSMILVKGVVMVTSVVALAAGIIWLAYRYWPALRDSLLGQVIRSIHNELCITIEECKVNNSAESA
jgi:hypothetical protein